MRQGMGNSFDAWSSGRQSSSRNWFRRRRRRGFLHFPFPLSSGHRRMEKDSEANGKVYHLPDDNNALIISTCKELTVWRPANNIYSALMPVVITDFKFHHYGVILVHWVETILLFNVHQGLGLANSCLQYKESHLVRSERQKRSTLSSSSSSFLTPQITTWVSEPAVANLVGWPAWGGCEKGS